MKYLYLVAAFLLGTTFVACDPVEDDFDSLNSASSDKIKVEYTVTNEGGKNINQACIKVTADFPTWIVYNCPDHATRTLTKYSTWWENVTLRALGENPFTVYGLQPDGTKIEKKFSINCENMTIEVLPFEINYWEGSQHGGSWNGNCFRFSAAESDPVGSLPFLDEATYDHMVGRNIYVETTGLPDAKIRVTTGWWTALGNGGDVYAKPVDDSTTTFYFKMTADMAAIMKTQDMSFILEGGEMTMIRIYYEP